MAQVRCPSCVRTVDADSPHRLRLDPFRVAERVARSAILPASNYIRRILHRSGASGHPRLFSTPRARLGGLRPSFSTRCVHIAVVFDFMASGTLWVALEVA